MIHRNSEDGGEHVDTETRGEHVDIETKLHMDNDRRRHVINNQEKIELLYNADLELYNDLV